MATNNEARGNPQNVFDNLLVSLMEREESIKYNKDWYNMENRTNYEFASYLVITENDNDREYHLIEDKEHADNFKCKCENDKVYNFISKVFKINKETNNLILQNY